MTKRIKGSCTTMLVGKKASIDGSTIIARNEDGAGPLNPQKFVVVNPEDQPRHYKSVLSQVEIDCLMIHCVTHQHLMPPMAMVPGPQRYQQR